VQLAVLGCSVAQLQRVVKPKQS